MNIAKLIWQLDLFPKDQGTPLDVFLVEVSILMTFKICAYYVYKYIQLTEEDFSLDVSETIQYDSTLHNFRVCAQ